MSSRQKQAAQTTSRCEICGKPMRELEATFIITSAKAHRPSLDICQYCTRKLYDRIDVLRREVHDERGRD